MLHVDKICAYGESVDEFLAMNVKGIFESVGCCYLAIIKIMKLAEVSPVSCVLSDKSVSNILEVNVDQVINYQRMDSIRVASECFLNMKTLGRVYVKIYIEGSKKHIAIINQKKCDSMLVRVHSACYTGDVLESLLCDCNSQLYSSLEKIASDGGVLLYLDQEGRGIGLINKLVAYSLQEVRKIDTVEANLCLGFECDERDFEVAGLLLSDLGIKKIRLMTNNSDKAQVLNKYVEIVELIPVRSVPTECNGGYLRTKRDKMHHML